MLAIFSGTGYNPTVVVKQYNIYPILNSFYLANLLLPQKKYVIKYLVNVKQSKELKGEITFA